MGSMTAHMACPHCEKRITVHLNVTEDPEGRSSKGPPPYDPGIEIDTLIIDAIETYRTSFSAVAQILEERNVPTAKGGKRWYPASAKRAYDNALARRAKQDNSETPN